MTCIVGISDGKKVYIGGDSAGIAGYSMSVRADKKVFKNGDFIFGFCGSFRLGQLLHHSFSPPKRYPDDDIDEFMVTEFVDAIRECLKKGGVSEKRHEAEGAGGGSFLVGYEGRLFVIHDDYQVGESADGYDAVGCGEDIAKGVLFATRKLKPRESLRLALEASERHSAGVRGPFHFEEI